MPYVYLIKMDSCFKIGIAQDVESRLAQLQTGSPYDLEVVQCYEFHNAQTVEGALHQKFGDVRMRGEWFRLKENQVIEFGNICSMLGGLAYRPDNVSLEDIEDAEEEIEKPVDGGKWDYKAMFADGWRMEKQTNGRHVGEGCRYWAWRRGSKNPKEYIYGGSLSNLPCPIEEMRNRYQNFLVDGVPVIPVTSTVATPTSEAE